jgi:hypothetical protein
MAFDVSRRPRLNVWGVRPSSQLFHLHGRGKRLRWIVLAALVLFGVVLVLLEVAVQKGGLMHVSTSHGGQSHSLGIGFP